VAIKAQGDVVMKLDPVKVVKVRGLEDLGRFAASIAGLGQPIYVIHFMSSEGHHVYGILAVYRDYYNLYGVPIFYYFESKEELRGKYILVKADEHREQVVVSSGIRPGWIHIPIITLEEKPDFIDL